MILKVFHPGLGWIEMKSGKKKRMVMFSTLLVTGAALAVMGTVAGADGAFQGTPEKLEVEPADGSLLIFRQGKMIDNISIPGFPEMRGIAFIRGERGESGTVGIHSPALGMRVNMAKPISGGVRIDLDIPTQEEIEQMRDESQKAVDEAIEIIENQKEISVEKARARVMRSPEEPEKIDKMELWITYVENEEMTFARAIVDWDSKEITSFENVSEFGIIPIPPEITMEMEELEEMRLIVMQDNRVEEITEGQKYIILPRIVTEKEGELILGMESACYTIIVDLENKRVKSIEEMESL